MKLPELIDRRQLQRETGLPRSAIDAIFRKLPVVTLPDHRKVYVRREHVVELIESGTHPNDGTAVRLAPR